MATTSERKRGGAGLRAGGALLVTAATLVLVGRRLDFDAVLGLLDDIRLPWLGAALALFATNYLLRSLRFRLLTYSGTAPLLRTFGVSAIHGLFNYLLPAKLGELAYPLLARSHLGLSMHEGTATLIVARFWDFSILALLLPLVAASFSAGLPHWAQWSMLVFPVVFLLAAAGTLRLAAGASPAPQHAPQGRVTALLGSLLVSLRSVHGQGNHLRLALLSATIWLCIYGNFYALVRALGMETSLLEMAVVSTVLLPLSLIPVQGIANIGSHELAWVTALGLFGHDLDSSLRMAVGTHILLLLLVLLLGLSGLACLALARRR